MEKVQIEGNKDSVYVTVLKEQGKGYLGLSAHISKKSLINQLIEEGTLKDEETVYFEEE